MIRQNILLLILIVVLAGTIFVWYQYVQIIPEEKTRPASEFEASLKEIRRLRQLELDTSVLNDPLFRALETPLPEVDTSQLKTGRENPFIPF